MNYRNHMKMQKFTIFVKKHLKTKLLKISKYCKVRDHCNYTGENRGVAHSVCNLRYTVHKEIPIVFHNGSNYKYYFIIKDLTEELEGKFTCLGENTKKYVSFSVPLEEKVTRIDRKRKKISQK